MMQPIYYKIFPILFSLLFSLYLAASNDQSERFVQCLLQNSNNSTAMSQIIYTGNNPSYTQILFMYIRNLRYTLPNTPKPAVILTPTQESQVQAAIYCAKKTGLQMRTRSGGNDLEGSSYVSYDPFFILEINGFRSISVDVAAKTAWVGAGATLGELYYKINQTDSSLAFPGGYWPTVGVSGHVCSSGFGGLTRMYGLSGDNVVDAHIITAKGEILDRKSMKKDLFWALQGGGCDSFGVVIALKLKLARIPRTIAAFTVARTLEQDATSLIHKWQYVAPSMPRELALSLQLVNNLPSNTTKQTVVANFVASFIGDIKTLISLMDQHFPELGVEENDCTMVGWAEYNLYHFGFPLQNAAQLLLGRNHPGGIGYLKLKADFVQRPISKKGLKQILKMMMQVASSEAQMEWTPFGGKMDEISESSTPFPNRKGNLYLMEERISWRESTPVETEKRLDWSRRLYMILGYYVDSNPRRAFVNYRDYDLGVNNKNGPTSVKLARHTWGAAYFRGNYDRLVRVKTMVDPENFFQHEQSIPVLP